MSNIIACCASNYGISRQPPRTAGGLNRSGFDAASFCEGDAGHVEAYPVEQRERAVKMVLDHLGEYRSVYAACQVIGPKVGVGAESLRRWVLQAQVDAAQRPGVTSAEQQRIKDLERENRDLKEANEILKAASIFFNHEAGIKPGTVQLIRRSRVRAPPAPQRICEAQRLFCGLLHLDLPTRNRLKVAFREGSR